MRAIRPPSASFSRSEKALRFALLLFLTLGFALSGDPSVSQDLQTEGLAGSDPPPSVKLDVLLLLDRSPSAHAQGRREVIESLADRLAAVLTELAAGRNLQLRIAAANFGGEIGHSTPLAPLSPEGFVLPPPETIQSTSFPVALQELRQRLQEGRGEPDHLRLGVLLTDAKPAFAAEPMTDEELLTHVLGPGEGAIAAEYRRLRGEGVEVILLAVDDDELDARLWRELLPEGYYIEIDPPAGEAASSSLVAQVERLLGLLAVEPLPDVLLPDTHPPVVVETPEPKLPDAPKFRWLWLWAPLLALAIGLVVYFRHTLLQRLRRQLLSVGDEAKRASHTLWLLALAPSSFSEKARDGGTSLLPETLFSAFPDHALEARAIRNPNITSWLLRRASRGLRKVASDDARWVFLARLSKTSSSILHFTVVEEIFADALNPKGEGVVKALYEAQRHGVALAVDEGVLEAALSGKTNETRNSMLKVYSTHRRVAESFARWIKGETYNLPADTIQDLLGKLAQAHRELGSSQKWSRSAGEDLDLIRAYYRHLAELAAYDPKSPRSPKVSDFLERLNGSHPVCAFLEEQCQILEAVISEQLWRDPGKFPAMLNTLRHPQTSKGEEGLHPARALLLLTLNLWHMRPETVPEAAKVDLFLETPRLPLSADHSSTLRGFLLTRDPIRHNIVLLTYTLLPDAQSIEVKSSARLEFEKIWQRKEEFEIELMLRPDQSPPASVCFSVQAINRDWESVEVSPQYIEVQIV